jgi:hypothetical protein
VSGAELTLEAVQAAAVLHATGRTVADARDMLPDECRTLGYFIGLGRDLTADEFDDAVLVLEQLAWATERVANGRALVGIDTERAS